MYLTFPYLTLHYYFYYYYYYYYYYHYYQQQYTTTTTTTTTATATYDYIDNNTDKWVHNDVYEASITGDYIKIVCINK